ncbi:MAG: hypothetical protein AAGA69_01010 [Pseudomonadota bacterium]
MRFIGTIFKYFVLLVLVGIALLVLLPLLPVAKDRMTAGKYTSWLEAEAISLDLARPDAGFSFPDDIGDARLILLSEIHGYRAVQKLDLALVTRLNENFGVRTYLAELNPAQAMAFNEYLAGGGDAEVRGVFDYWAEGTYQWANREFFEKLGALRQHNEKAADQDRIWFVGVDSIGDRDFAERIASMQRPQSTPGFGVLASVQAINAQLIRDTLARDEDASRYTHIEANVATVAAMPGAGSETFYGLWGLFHGSKVMINGSRPLSMRLNAEGGPFEGGVITLGTICVDNCFNMMPAAAAPGPFKPKNGEPYVLMPMNFDSAYLSRTRGIQEIKKVMGDARVAMVPVSAEGSPYLKGKRLTKSTGYITMIPGYSFEYEGPAGEAMDYVIVMRGSAALTPWKGEAYDVTRGGAANAGIN